MKICLAGSYAITNENRKIVKESKYILESFYYIKEWQIPHIKNFDLFLRKYDGIEFQCIKNNDNRAGDFWWIKL